MFLVAGYATLQVTVLVRWKVCQSVGLSVCRSVPPLLFRRFWRFASGFCITAPAQWHVTDAVVYTALPTAPAHHITAPAQPPRLRVSCIRPCFYTNDAKVVKLK